MKSQDTQFVVGCSRRGFYLCDPNAPLAFGDPVVLQVAPDFWCIGGTLRTQRPTRSKTLTVEVDSGIVERRVTRDRVARVVRKFEPI